MESGTKAKLLLNLANDAMGEGDYASAIKHLRAALQLDPRLSAAHGALGKAYADLGDLDRAVETLRRAVAFDPEGGGAHLQLAQTYALLNRTDEALEACRRAIEVQPDLSAAHMTLGDLLVAQGATDEAMDAYKAALRTNPQLSQARFKLANLYIAKDNSTEAYLESREAMSLHPHIAATRMRLGDMHVRRREYSNALREYLAALDSNLADEGAVYYRIGCVYFAQDRYDEAVEAFRSALEREAELAACHYKIGVARFAQGRYAEAIDAYTASLENMPFSSTLCFNIGEGYRGLEQSDKAIEFYRKALDVDPSLKVAKERLDLLEGRPAPLEARKLLWIPLAPTDERHTLLHCSGPDDERMLIPASEAQRIEELPLTAIVMRDGLPHVPYVGEMLPLIDVARALPNKRRAARHPDYYRQALSKTTFQMIVYGVGANRVGLVINEVRGRVEESYVLRGGSSRSGVLFTTILDDRVAEVLDVPRIVRDASGARPPDAVLDVKEVIGSVPSQFFGE